MTRLGSKLVFEEANEEVELLLGIDMNAKQIERICHYYGDLIEQIEWREAYSDGIQLKLNYNPDEDIYIMLDGSMLLTREDDWKEIKLGRIFTSSSMTQLSKERGMISDTVYTSHFGKSSEFWEKLSKEIPNSEKLVFINDGAKWIWNYIQDCYPSSTQILDFYHCKEHLFDFAKIYYNKEKVAAEEFVDNITSLLFGKQVDEALNMISLLDSNSKRKQLEKTKLLNYLETNKKRINYGEFISKGLLIGSGAIEAAHRNVIQKRLKLSGQRWTIQGAQQIANLRTYKHSNRWDNVVELITDYKLAS